VILTPCISTSQNIACDVPDESDDPVGLAILLAVLCDKFLLNEPIIDQMMMTRTDYRGMLLLYVI